MATVVNVLGPALRWVKLSEIVVDPEFRDLALRVAEDEGLAASVAQEGSDGAVIVWRCRGQRILLIDYRRYWLGDSDRPVLVLEKEFASREEARRFVQDHPATVLGLGAGGCGWTPKPGAGAEFWSWQGAGNRAALPSFAPASAVFVPACGNGQTAATPSTAAGC